jgi:hypothetical protein
MISTSIPKARHLVLVFSLLSLGGCANSLPFFSELIPDDVPSTTGSLFSPSATLSNELTSADWEKANNALGAALRPDNIDNSVQWENRATAAKGYFRPLNAAFVRDGDLCRAFVSQITIENKVRPTMQAIACRSGASDWQISDVKGLVRQG